MGEGPGGCAAADANGSAARRRASCAAAASPGCRAYGVHSGLRGHQELGNVHLVSDMSGKALAEAAHTKTHIR